MQKPEVVAGDAGDGCDRLVIREIGGVQLQAEFPPVAVGTKVSSSPFSGRS